MNVDIVGVGLGPGTLTSDAAAALDRADLLIGSPRLLSEHSSVPATVQATRPDQVLAAIQASGADQICVLMSGDTGFYSGAHGVLSGLLAAGFRLSDRPWPDDGSATADTVRVLPGIASPVLLAARLGIPWEHAALVSAHGRGTSISGAVRHSRYTFVLTGDNMAELADELIAAGFEDLHCLGGSDLGLSAEQIADCRVDQLPHRKWPSLSVLLVENPNPDPRVPAGLPDDSFLRTKIPMTKRSVRALAMAKLSVAPDELCFDIGCGTGSVSVELALAAHRGWVYAVDQKPEAVDLTSQNAKRFHCGNIRVALGDALTAIADWPAPDAVFIGGSSGHLGQIVAAVLAKNPVARIAISAIAPETTAAALRTFRKHDIRPELTQLNVAEGRMAGELHLMMAQNPVTLISGCRDGD